MAGGVGWVRWGSGCGGTRHLLNLPKGYRTRTPGARSGRGGRRTGGQGAPGEPRTVGRCQVEEMAPGTSRADGRTGRRVGQLTGWLRTRVAARVTFVLLHPM